MSSVYAGIVLWHASIVIPSDGDPAVAESVNVALRALQDSNNLLFNSVQHKMMDSRGLTSTLTGSIVINDGGGDITYNVQNTFNGQTDFFGGVTLHSSAALNVNPLATFNTSVVVGGSAAHHLTVNATTDFNAETFYHDDATFGHDVGIGGTLDVTGTVDFQGDSQLGQAGTVTTVGGQLVVNQESQFTGTLRTSGDTHLGNSATDFHLVSGTAEFQNDVQMDAALTVAGNLVVSGSDNDLGLSASIGDLNILGSTTIGNSASDTLIVNALMGGGALGFVGGGRIPRRIVLATGSAQSLLPSDGNTLIVRGSASPVIVLLSSSATTANGDFWHVFAANGATPTIQYLDAFTGLAKNLVMANNDQAFFIRVQSFLGWIGGKWATTPGS